MFTRAVPIWSWVCGVVIAAGAGIAAPQALAGEQGAVPPNVTTRGVHFVNRHGNVVLLRGVDAAAKTRYIEEAVAVGSNFVRLRVMWAHAQPVPGALASSEVAQLDTAVAYLAAHRVNIELDLRGHPAPAWFGPTEGFFSTNRVASQAAYLGFVRAIVRRYDRNPYVVGYGIFNEPQPFGWNGGGLGAARYDRRILRWQAGVRNAIRAIDPYRVVFLNVRGGNYGLKTCFRCVGFRVAHTVIDWHDFYNGCCGSGMDAADDNWVPDWPSTHNQRSTCYEGTIANQWANLSIPWKASHRLGIPMIVGEWGVRNDDVHATVYDEQMERLFDNHGISWARWDMDGNSALGLIHNHELNAEGQWLRGELLGLH